MTPRTLVRRRVAFLHTASSNIGLFEDAGHGDASHPAFDQRHEVRPDLLAAVSGGSGERDAAFEETRRELLRLAEVSDAVVLTCSSLGPACEGWPDAPGALFRADEALARSSASKGGRVLALYAAPSSEGPTVQLFQSAAARSSAHVECRLVEGAWAHFQEGRYDEYEAAIARVVQSEHANYDMVALAQASMAVALRSLGPLTTVRTVPDAVMARLDALFKAVPTSSH